MSARIGNLAFALSALLWVFALAATSAAQPRVEENVNLVVTGEITAIDPDARTITVKSTNDDGIAYQVDASATVMSGAQKLALGDLKTGWSVAMNGHRTGDTRRITLIKVVKAP
jgi:Cu/Ag efflux protein CusF